MSANNKQRTTISYAWVILGVLYIGLVAAFGMRSSFGAYISPWEKEFSVSRSVVTSISMVNFAVFAIGQPLAGKLNDYFGKSFVPSVSIFLVGISLLLTSRATQMWQVFLLFGVLFSFGVAGCSNSIPVVIISNWFKKKKGLALGLAMSGMAVGQLIMVPVNLFIIDSLGWRQALVILSIVIMVVVGPLYIFLLRYKPEEKGMKPYGYSEPEAVNGSIDAGNAVEPVSPKKDKPVPVFRVFKLKSFWCITIPYFVCGFTDVGLIQTHLIPMAQGKGFPLANIALASSMIAIANIAGTIVTGHLSDLFSNKRQLALIYALRAATYVFLIFIKSSWLLPVFAIIYGAVEMASIAPTNSLVVQMFGKFSTGAVLGIVAVSHQLGGAIGSWLPGKIFDMTGSYNAILIISVLMLLAGSGIILQLAEPDRQKEKKLQQSELQ